jgi:hypothetical protein
MTSAAIVAEMTSEHPASDQPGRAPPVASGDNAGLGSASFDVTAGGSSLADSISDAADHVHGGGSTEFAPAPPVIDASGSGSAVEAAVVAGPDESERVHSGGASIDQVASTTEPSQVVAAAALESPQGEAAVHGGGVAVLVSGAGEDSAAADGQPATS